jgi:opine dehydrogenase
MTHAEILDRMYAGVPLTVVPMQGPVLEGSRSVPPRYLTEDIPMGLAPWASLRKGLGAATLTVTMIIRLASLVKRTDFWAEGRTLERAGFAGKTASEILAAVSA